MIVAVVSLPAAIVTFFAADVDVLVYLLFGWLLIGASVLVIGTFAFQREAVRRHSELDNATAQNSAFALASSDYHNAYHVLRNLLVVLLFSMSDGQPLSLAEETHFHRQLIVALRHLSNFFKVSKQVEVRVTVKVTPAQACRPA